MTIEELVTEFKKLSPQDRATFVERVQRIREDAVYRFRPGQRVRFEAREGIYIEGTFVRMKQKYAEVSSEFDRYGRKVAHKIRWSVMPRSLTAVDTPEPAPTADLTAK